jgi:hypothetical protein
VRVAGNAGEWACDSGAIARRGGLPACRHPPPSAAVDVWRDCTQAKAQRREWMAEQARFAYTDASAGGGGTGLGIGGPGAVSRRLSGASLSGAATAMAGGGDAGTSISPILRSGECADGSPAACARLRSHIALPPVMPTLRHSATTAQAPLFAAVRSPVWVAAAAWRAVAWAWVEAG